MINVRIANISPKVTKNLPNQLKTPRFKENFTIDMGAGIESLRSLKSLVSLGRGRRISANRVVKDLKDLSLIHI